MPGCGTSRRAQADGHALCAPIAGLPLEVPRDFAAAEFAAVPVEVPFAEHIPVALDDALSASGAPRAATGRIVDVAGVHVAQSLRERDFARARERGGRRVRLVEH